MFAKKHPKRDFVLHRKDGNKWSKVLDGFKRMIRFAGLPNGVTPHSLRHTFGAWLAQAGISMQKIQKLLGHESVRTTEKYYAHLSPDSFTSALNVLNESLPKLLPSSPETGSKSIKEKTVNLLESWCRGRESNPYDPCGSQDFKSDPAPGTM
jgi:hypothetical protein